MVLVTLVGWTWRRSPILPSGSSPFFVNDSNASASNRLKLRSKSDNNALRRASTI